MKKPVKLNPELLRQLADEIRSGRLATFEVSPVEGRSRRWTAEYTLSEQSHSSAANYDARHQGASLLLDLAGHLEGKRITTLFIKLVSPSTYKLAYSLSMEYQDEAEIAPEPEKALADA